VAADPSVKGPRRQRRWIPLGLVGLICASLFAGATGVLFIWPSTDRPGRADAVVVLGGDGSRLVEGQALVREGVAPVLAVSVGSPDDSCYRDLEPFAVVCFRPRPFTTQGEARWLAATARSRGWHDVVVVVSSPQATRARLRVRRCYSGGLQVVAVDLSVARRLTDAAYEWGALLKALVIQRSC